MYSIVGVSPRLVLYVLFSVRFLRLTCTDSYSIATCVSIITSMGVGSSHYCTNKARVRLIKVFPQRDCCDRISNPSRRLHSPSLAPRTPQTVDTAGRIIFHEESGTLGPSTPDRRGPPPAGIRLACTIYIASHPLADALSVLALPGLLVIISIESRRRCHETREWARNLCFFSSSLVFLSPTTRPLLFGRLIGEAYVKRQL